MRIFILFSIATSLLACSGKRSFNLKLSDATGVTTSSPVLCNGLAIGKVNRISLSSKYEVIVEVKLIGDIQEVPDDSRVSLTSEFLGRSIDIEFGNSSTYLSETDTLTVVSSLEEVLFEEDPLITVLGEGFRKLSGEEKLDSILFELRRLNDNLEKFNH